MQVTGAHIMGAHIMGAHIMGAHVMGAHVMGAHVMGAHAMGAPASSARAMGAPASGAHVRAAQVMGPQTSEAQASDALTFGAPASGARARAVQVMGPQTSEAQASDAQAAEEQAFGAQTSGAETSGAETSEAQASEAQGAGPLATAAQSARMTRQQLALVSKLAAIDHDVRSHEMAHLAAAGPYARGGPTYEEVRGPDGNLYAVAGEVSLDVSPVPNDPRATIRKAETIRAAANAPVDPSSQDRAVAAEAVLMAARAEEQLAAAQTAARGNASFFRAYQRQDTPASGGLLSLLL